MISGCAESPATATCDCGEPHNCQPGDACGCNGSYPGSAVVELLTHPSIAALYVLATPYGELSGSSGTTAPLRIPGEAAAGRLHHRTFAGLHGGAWTPTRWAREACQCCLVRVWVCLNTSESHREVRRVIVCRVKERRNLRSLS